LITELTLNFVYTLVGMVSDGAIITISTLNPHTVHPDFEASYLSKHKRNYGKNDEFSIYHLLFDYSKIVVD